MIPIGPGDIAAIVKAAGVVLDEIRRERTAKLLHDWAELMIMPDSEDRAVAIRQFTQDRTQERGFTPWYDGTESVPVPKDLLTDMIDLLIEPIEGAKNTATKFLDAARRAIGFRGVADKDRAVWAALIQDRKPDLIVEMLESQVARRGRQRAYSASQVIDMDLDWVADVGIWLING